VLLVLMLSLLLLFLALVLLSLPLLLSLNGLDSLSFLNSSNGGSSSYSLKGES